MHLPARILLLPCLLAALTTSARSAGPFFNILDYGARNDGSAPATEAFRAAIQAAHAAGGGTVFVPAGRYTSGPIELVSNLILYSTPARWSTSPRPCCPSRADGSRASRR